MVRIELKVLGQTIAAETPQPPERVRLDEVLPLLYEIDNQAIDLAVKRVEADGKRISCQKGCSVCCRAQPVPITPPEAYALSRLIANEPEPRRGDLLARIEANVNRLREAGLLEVLLREQPVESKGEARELAWRYFQLGLVCPFLEDDACSIYRHRPFVCRQYLVTSPAALCSNPFANPVEPVPMPLQPATGMLAVAGKFLGRQQFSMPLTVLLEYVERHANELDRKFPAQKVFRKSVAAIATEKGSGC